MGLGALVASGAEMVKISSARYRAAQAQANTNAKEVLAQAEAKAAHLAKGAPRKKPRRPWNLKGVQFGPTHGPQPKPGNTSKRPAK